jgi:glycosyltransferase involved in cell wall biosynthesis
MKAEHERTAAAVRLLWVSETPTALTGFGTVTRELLRRLARLPSYEIAAVASGYTGWPYDRTWIPFELYPSASFGRDVLEKAIVHFRPTIVAAFGDPWMIDYLADFRLPPACRLVLYLPLDGEPFPAAWRRLIEAADAAVCCSHYGAALTSAACPAAEVSMIYHGVDRTVFRPLPDKEEVKERLGLGRRFVIGCVARNQPRKSFPILLKAFARFAASHEDALLYLHTDPRDIGWDLIELTQRYGIETRTCFSRHATISHGFDGRTLNEIYNAFDVMALPSMGEGFGLPLLEAMAAGTPVIATDFSASAELVRGRGELIAVKERLTIGRNIEQAIADTDDLVACMERLYDDPLLRARHRRAGLAFARELEWKNIVPQWRRLFESVIDAKAHPSSGA